MSRVDASGKEVTRLVVETRRVIHERSRTESWHGDVVLLVYRTT